MNATWSRPMAMQQWRMHRKTTRHGLLERFLQRAYNLLLLVLMLPALLKKLPPSRQFGAPS